MTKEQLLDQEAEHLTRQMDEYVYAHEPIWFRYTNKEGTYIYIHRSRTSVYMDDNINTRVIELGVNPAATKEQVELFDIYNIDPTTIRAKLRADERINWVKYCECENDDLLICEYAQSLGYGKE